MVSIEANQRSYRKISNKPFVGKGLRPCQLGGGAWGTGGLAVPVKKKKKSLVESHVAEMGHSIGCQKTLTTVRHRHLDRGCGGIGSYVSEITVENLLVGSINEPKIVIRRLRALGARMSWVGGAIMCERLSGVLTSGHVGQ